VTTHPTAPWATLAQVRTQPRPRFRDLIAAEWIKIRSQRSTFWTLIVTALVVVAAAVNAAHSDYSNFPAYSPSVQRIHGFSLSDAFPPVGYMILLVVAAGTGALAIVGEYSSGLIRITTVAVPARRSVVLAKAVVVAALWTVAGAIISTASFVISQVILSGRHAGDSITSPGALPALLAATLLGPVCALTGLGLGVLIRHSVATIVSLVVILVLLPQSLPTRQAGLAAINHLMVLAAWQRLTWAYGPPAAIGYRYATVTGSWVVYAAWPAIAIALALIVVQRRDV
jgi:ABC-2 type transport system permease protein